MSARSIASASRYRVLGVAFLALVLFFVWATYAIFTKKFVDYVPVTLQTSKIGLQLPALADVKIRGVQVGEVRSIDSDGSDGAQLELAIIPDMAKTIPANVSAQIIPKTLFGEKYVALQVPDSPSDAMIASGDVIERSDVAIEVEKVLSDIYPLLRTVQPADLNYTLTAIATALEGRGEEIGNNLQVLDDYLTRTNPKIPLLIDDLNKLSAVSDTYRQVVPDLANLLRNSVTTGNTFVEKEQKIQAFFNDLTGFSNTTRDFLDANGDNIIRLSKQGQAQLPLFARYAPEYPCLIKGMVNWTPHMEQAYRGYTLHISLETLKNTPTGYSTADDPKYAAHNGPHCGKLPNPPYSQSNVGPQPAIHEVDDGVTGGHGKFRPRSAPGTSGPGKSSPGKSSPGATASDFDFTSGLAGTKAERSLVATLVAPTLGVSIQDVPDVATLLFAPLARGTKVSLR